MVGGHTPGVVVKDIVPPPPKESSSSFNKPTPSFCKFSHKINVKYTFFLNCFHHIATNIVVTNSNV